jgi:TonB family protein
MPFSYRFAALAFCLLSVAAWGQRPPGALSTPVQRDDPTVFAEELPPVGRGNLYTAPQIRYCLAESIRIEAVRRALDRREPESVEEFNARVADFNSRCASYRFYESEMFFVKREVQDHRTRLQAEAREDYLRRAAARKAARAPSAPPTLTKTEPEVAKEKAPLPPSGGAEPVVAAPPEPKVQETPPTASDRAAVPAATAPAVSPPEAPSAPAEMRKEEPPSASARPGPGVVAPAQSAEPAVLPPKPAEPAAAPPEPPAKAARAEPTVEPMPAPTGVNTPEVQAPPPRAATPEPTAVAPASPSKPAEPAASASEPGPKTTRPERPVGPPPAVAERRITEAPTPAPAGAVPGPLAAEPPQQPPPAAAAKERPQRPATPPANDPALTRYVQEVKRVGARVLNEQQYPEAARGKGLSGTTQIEVRFSAGGFIRSIVLGEGSGHAELDAHALAIARGIMFPHVPKGLYSREFDVRFPISYKPQAPPKAQPKTQPTAQPKPKARAPAAPQAGTAKSRLAQRGIRPSAKAQSASKAKRP